MKDLNKYQIAFESKVHGVKLYIPATDTDYHLSRYVAAGAQNIYSSVGATREVLEKISTDVLGICNADKKQADGWRGDISTLMNNIKYRLQYPIDEDCAIRMGAIYCFFVDENPDEVNDIYTRNKITLAKGDANNNIPCDPELYAFFLNMGVANTPSWREYVHHLDDTTYFQKREDILRTLTPQNTP